jgi:hypothetical protein
MFFEEIAYFSSGGKVYSDRQVYPKRLDVSMLKISPVINLPRLLNKNIFFVETL